MNKQLQRKYPLQARYYRAMRFYLWVPWALLLWAASIVPVSVGVAPRFLPRPWGIAPLLLQLFLGIVVATIVAPWLDYRYHRVRRVYRLLNWKGCGLKFSHFRAWHDWPNEKSCPEG